jgi:spore germination cell wall hydrolase CwlJ-like protein
VAGGEKGAEGLMTDFLQQIAKAVGTRDVQILAQTILGEAEGEELAGKIAVAWVVVNRAIARKQTISFVCTAPFQFSCWNSDSPRLKGMLEANISQQRFRECYGVACMVTSGAYHDITEGATFYHTIAQPVGAKQWPPSWAASMQKTQIIGAQQFYKEGV